LENIAATSIDNGTYQGLTAIILRVSAKPPVINPQEQALIAAPDASKVTQSSPPGNIGVWKLRCVFPTAKEPTLLRRTGRDTSGFFNSFRSSLRMKDPVSPALVTAGEF